MEIILYVARQIQGMQQHTLRPLYVLRLCAWTANLLIVKTTHVLCCRSQRSHHFSGEDQGKGEFTEPLLPQKFLFKWSNLAL